MKSPSLREQATRVALRYADTHPLLSLENLYKLTALFAERINKTYPATWVSNTMTLRHPSQPEYSMLVSLIAPYKDINIDLHGMGPKRDRKKRVVIPAHAVEKATTPDDLFKAFYPAFRAKVDETFLDTFAGGREEPEYGRGEKDYYTKRRRRWASK